MVFGDTKCVHEFSHNHLLLIRAAVLPFTNLSSRNYLLCIDDLTVMVKNHQLQEGELGRSRDKLGRSRGVDEEAPYFPGSKRRVGKEV